MIHRTILPAVLLMLLVVSGADRAVAADDAVANASAKFQQSAYEFALHLGLEEPGAALRQMQETSRQGRRPLRDSDCSITQETRLAN
jgi:hypothetical protein